MWTGRVTDRHPCMHAYIHMNARTDTHLYIYIHTHMCLIISPFIPAVLDERLYVQFRWPLLCSEAIENSDPELLKNLTERYKELGRWERALGYGPRGFGLVAWALGFGLTVEGSGLQG